MTDKIDGLKPEEIVLEAELEELETLRPSIARKAVKEPVASLAERLDEAAPETLQKARDALKLHSSEQLIQAYETKFFANQRVAAFLRSEALAERGVPPCFRIKRSYKTDSLTLSQKFDLILHDLQWIAVTYPEHKGKGGYAAMLEGKGGRWLKVAEYYQSLKSQGSEVWMFVRQLRLDEDKQWECLALRSMPIKKKASGLKRRHETLKKALDAHHMKKVTGLHNLKPHPAYERRLKVWVCGEMTSRSPTKAARLYRMWTGETIRRQVANDDLQWLKRKIPESRPPRRQRTQADEDDGE